MSEATNGESGRGLGAAHLFGVFVFLHKCRDFAEAYTVALKVLGEEAKDQWTPEDVVEAVLRSIEMTPNDPS